MLWQDQVSLAETLHEKRRTYSLGFVLIGGLGLFKLDWHRRADLVPAIPDGSARVWAIALLIASLAMFLLSAYCIFTERAFLRPLLARVIRLGESAARGWLPTVGWSVGEEELPAVPADGEALGGRAINALTFTTEEMESIISATDEELWELRASRLALAHARLTLANRRVEQRISAGLAFMILGYGLAGGLIVLYALFQR